MCRRRSLPRASPARRPGTTRGRLSSFPGGYSDYLAKKAELMAHEERVEQNRQNILRREREWLSRGPKARGTKQKALKN